ncbi:phage head morphogenesis protein [Variovorax boronicumulans]|uniref:phage head morphogenesis protein n=1 Tax=Variovorax boronicumulans TaxID=436515 RepID=UPI001C59CCBC
MATSIRADMEGVRQRFQEQIDFFRAKLALPTERWDDIWQRAHDRAFIVAGAQKADLLSDLFGAVGKAVAGGSIGEFRKAFADAVSRSGWTGWTGEGTKAGEAWRTRTIYRANVSASYGAGRWAQLTAPGLVAVRPFWRYVHADGVLHPRPLHLSWHGITLPHDHEWWKTHFGPNGWGCGCYVVAVRSPGDGDQVEPPAAWDEIDPKTGAPAGIDRGWGYAPGASSDVSLQQMVEEKLITYPPAIALALSRALASRRGAS